MADLYDDLGVGKDATKEDIKRAYRRKAKEAHPDRGGNKEEFSRISLAYRILSDDNKRSRYDTKGETDDVENEMALVIEVIGVALEKVEQRGGIMTIDPLASLKNVIQSDVDQAKQATAQLRDQMASLERKAKRWKHKGDGLDIIGELFKQQIGSKRGAILHNERAIRIREKALLVLEGYRYEDEGVAPGHHPLFMQFRTTTGGTSV